MSFNPRMSIMNSCSTLKFSNFRMISYSIVQILKWNTSFYWNTLVGKYIIGPFKIWIESRAFEPKDNFFITNCFVAMIQILKCYHKNVEQSKLTFRTFSVLAFLSNVFNMWFSLNTWSEIQILTRSVETSSFKIRLYY